MGWELLVGKVSGMWPVWSVGDGPGCIGFCVRGRGGKDKILRGFSE